MSCSKCLEGEDLEDYATRIGPLAASEAVDFVLQSLQALAQAHALGFVHRDIKPSNLFLSKRPDGSAIVKVLDFGISKAPRLSGGPSSHATSTRAVLGSPYVHGPGAGPGARSVDPRADVWAIGVTLYRLLTGELPFGGETLTELLLSIVEATPPAPRSLRPDLPEALEASVLRCLRKDREERFANVAELAQALRPFAGSEGPSVDRISRTIGGEVRGSGACREYLRRPRRRWCTPAAVATHPSVGGRRVHGRSVPRGARARADGSGTASVRAARGRRGVGGGRHARVVGRVEQRRSGDPAPLARVAPCQRRRARCRRHSRACGAEHAHGGVADHALGDRGARASARAGGGRSASSRGSPDRFREPRPRRAASRDARSTPAGARPVCTGGARRRRPTRRSIGRHVEGRDTFCERATGRSTTPTRRGAACPA